MAKAKRPPPTTLYLSPELRARLRALSERSGASASELVRRALDAYLTRAEELLATFAADPSVIDRLDPLAVLVAAHDTGARALPHARRSK
jgi:predicted DNA-binding protein